jgi:dihydroorotate dehydrogenase
VLEGRVLYRFLVRPFLYLFSAETAHHLAIFALRFVQALPLGLALLRLVFARRSKKEVQALGLTFPSPLGLAAGFDKDAKVYRALGALGFGFVEVGTITAQGQPGNPKPRLFRLIKDRALINRMGFNNQGAAEAARRLRHRKVGSSPILGINIGKTKIVPAEEAAQDYEASAALLAPYADYFVVNVSSPNTPGLRDLQAVSSLRPILQTVRRALDRAVKSRHVPLLVKIAPDLADDDIIEVAALARELKLDGIIATNTTISREGLTTSPAFVSECCAGGLSGAPLKARALRVISLLRREVGPEMTLIAAGGIETAEDAKLRLAEGANLVQIYSALVFDGPSLPGRITGALS